MTAKPVPRSDAVIDEILQRISDGESVRSVCRDKHMPSKSNFMRWVSEDATLQDQYARAREHRADVHAEEIISIADECEEDQAAVAKARLRVDVRKWHTSKMFPKKYGDKLAFEGEVEVKGDSLVAAIMAGRKRAGLADE